MSADWYYLKTGFFGGNKTVGPIDEVLLKTNIERGIVSPETMVSSTTKTHGAWCKMRDIRVAMKVWEKSHPDEAAPALGR